MKNGALLCFLVVCISVHVSAATWFDMEKFNKLKKEHFPSGKCNENFDFVFFEGMCYYRMPGQASQTLSQRQQVCTNSELGEAFILTDSDGNVKENAFRFLKTHFMTRGTLDTYTGIDYNPAATGDNKFVVSKQGYARPKLDGYYTWTWPSDATAAARIAFGRPGGLRKNKYNTDISPMTRTGLHPWTGAFDEGVGSQYQVGGPGTEKPLYTLCVKQANEVQNVLQSRKCKAGQYLFRSKCYSFNMAKLDAGFLQSEAFQLCEDQQGIVVEPRTITDLHYIMVLANYSGVDYSGSVSGGWVGMTDPNDARANKRAIYRSDNTEINPSSPAWKLFWPGEPNNNLEDGIHFLFPLGFNDVRSTVPHPAVCEFESDPSEAECDELIANLDCPCGMTRSKTTLKCESSPFSTRLDEVSLLLSCTKKAYESNQASQQVKSGQYMNRAINCMKPTEIFTFDSIKEVDWRTMLWAKMEGLLDKMTGENAQPKVDVPAKDVIKSGAGKYHSTYLKLVQESNAFCKVPVKCGQKLSDWTDVTSSFVPVDSPVEALEISRAQALCDLHDFNRDSKNKQSFVAPGTFLLHSTICASNMRHAGKDAVVSTNDLAESVLGDATAIASEILAQGGSIENTVLSAVVRFGRGERFDAGFLPDRNTVPWFSMQFVMEAGDETSQSLNSAGTQLAAFNSQLKKLEQDDAIMRKIDEGNDRVIETVLDFFTDTKRVEYENIISDIDRAKGAIEVELDRTRLQAEESDKTMQKAVVEMEEAYADLTGKKISEQEKPYGGKLKMLQDATETLIEADGNLQEKIQIRNRRRAIFDLITSTISLATSAIGVGRAVSSAVKAGKRLGPKKLFNKAVDSAKQDPVGTVEDGLTVLDSAIQLASGELEDLPIIGEVITMKNSINTLINHEKELERIKQETNDSLKALDDAIDKVSVSLRNLANRAMAVSIAALRASEWLEDDLLDISVTKIDDALVESSQVWFMLQRDVVQQLIDLEICPGVDGKNPYRDTGRRLLATALHAPSKAVTVGSGLRTRARALVASVVKTPTQFARALGGKGDEEVEEARERAAEAWDEVSVKCRDFNQVLDKFIIWAAEAHNTFYQTVQIIREAVVVRARADSLQTGGWASAMNQTVDRLKAVRRSIAEANFEKASERALRSQFDASLFSQALVLERIVVDAIRSVCAAMYYTFPSTDMGSIKVSSIGKLELEVSGTDCEVRFRPLQMDALPTPLERLELLEKAIVSSGPIEQVWLKTLLADRTSQRTVNDLSCGLSQTRLLEDLLAANGNPVSFDIRPNSFTPDQTGSNCYPNAELRSFKVYFLNKDKSLVDTGNKFITVDIESSENSVFQKLKLEGNKAQELLFLGGKSRSERFAYRGPEASENCGSSLKLDRVPSSGQNVCTNDKDQDFAKYFAATPIYGRWSVSLPLGWPADVPKPAQMLIVLGFVSASCDIPEVTQAIQFSALRQGLSFDDDLLKVGLTCGLKDFPVSAALMESEDVVDDSTPPPQSPSIMPWLIPTVIGGVLALAGTAFVVRRRMMHRQQEELSLSASKVNTLPEEKI